MLMYQNEWGELYQTSKVEIEDIDKESVQAGILSIFRFKEDKFQELNVLDSGEIEWDTVKQQNNEP